EARLHYDRVAEANIDLSVASRAHPIGALHATGRLPFDLMKRRVPPSEPIELDLSVDGAELATLPLGQLGFAEPFTAGLVGGRARLRGTAHDPQVSVELEAKKLATEHVEDLGGRVTLRWADAQPQLHAEIDLRGGTLLKADARAQFSFQQLLAGAPWREAP